MIRHSGFEQLGRAALAALAAGLILTAPAAHARTNVELPASLGRAPSDLYALRPPYIFTHNAGLLTLQITNVGIIGNPYIDDFSAGWRGGEYLYFSGLWIGAIGSDSEPHVSTASPFELRPELLAAWTVYESFEGLKGGNRLGGADPKAVDDDKDGLVDEDFQNGLDDDGDGRIDEDYAAIGQQMFSCMYKDDTPEAIAQVSDHVPLNILVRQRSFGWSTAGINEFVGFEFEIVNTGDQRLREMFLGFFSDSDAGPKTAERYWTDDLVGWAHIDTTVTDPQLVGACATFDLAMDAAYMWDAPDNGTTIAGGDVPGVFGSLFLGHTTDDTGVRAPQNVGLTTVAWFSSSGANSDPQNDDERYALIAAGTKPQRNATKPDDYRYVIAAGPFAQLNPGESLVFQTAYVIGDGSDGFRANAVNAQRVFNGRYIDADQNPQTGVDGKERCLMVLQQGDEILWNDPCDTLDTESRFRDVGVCHWVDADCNSCTGINGEETLIQWVGTTAPPPPKMNTDPDLDPNFDVFTSPAGDRTVVLQWDNTSELRKDPITGEDLFEGYRVWRADNWQRPEGAIGPAPDEWMKIAEFRNNEAANSQGAQSIRVVTQRDVKEVGYTDDDDPKAIYPIGRYRYEDSNGILNGKVYFYSVTAFGLTSRFNPVTQRNEIIELGGQPSAVEAEMVVPRWDAVHGCDQVRVVPNPYRGRADWDLTPSDRDPTGTKIAFRNLPDEEATIRIYTLSGDLVQEARHDGADGDGTYFWNMITRNGQNITSGIYLYSVDSAQGICRGRFVVIR
jgi:hypothetical protein